MEISAFDNNLLPKTTATGTTSDAADLISQDAIFQSALDEASGKLERATNSKVKTMTQEELDKRDKEIRDASTELEAILLKMMYTEMYKTVPKDELFGDDNAMEIYQDMYHEELTKEAAKAGGIGLADFIYKQLTK
ncbi:MAG: rod-binding protein [Selenomonadaceae bacterium]|nr:rod-binding protein [Selenomonadaceae bacterium]